MPTKQLELIPANKKKEKHKCIVQGKEEAKILTITSENNNKEEGINNV